MLDELCLDNVEGAMNRLFEAMRRCQYVDDEQYFQASVFMVDLVDRDSVSTCAITSDVGYILAETDYFTFDSEPAVTIRYDSLLDLPGLDWEWLDETQLLVEPNDPADWPALLVAARNVETSLGE